MLVHPDSIVFADHAIKRAGDLQPGEQLVGLDARPSVRVRAVEHHDEPHQLVTLRSKHRELTTIPQTNLLMLRRDPVASYPPRDGWWTEEHSIEGLQYHRADEPCSITDCWCLKHKRHFVVLKRLENRRAFTPRCAVGSKTQPQRTKFDDHADATQARFEHIAHGHHVLPVHTSPRGHHLYIRGENTRDHQIHEWGIAPALPGPCFSVERVTQVTPTEGPLVWLDVREPVIIEATVVCP